MISSPSSVPSSNKPSFTKSITSPLEKCSSLTVPKNTRSWVLEWPYAFFIFIESNGEFLKCIVKVPSVGPLYSPNSRRISSFFMLAPNRMIPLSDEEPLILKSPSPRLYMYTFELAVM